MLPSIQERREQVAAPQRESCVSDKGILWVEFNVNDGEIGNDSLNKVHCEVVHHHWLGEGFQLLFEAKQVLRRLKIFVQSQLIRDFGLENCRVHQKILTGDLLGLLQDFSQFRAQHVFNCCWV